MTDEHRTLSESAHCQCAACKTGTIHASDCSIHNGPAFPIGPCDCGAAAPAQSGEPVDSHHFVQPVPDHCDRIVWQGRYYALKKSALFPVSAAPQSSQPVEAGDDVRERIARVLHYPACWDTASYPTLESAAWEAIACAKLGCSTCEAAPAVVLDDERAAFKELRSQMAYIAAYDLNELDGMSKDRLAGRLRSVIDRARAASQQAKDKP